MKKFKKMILLSVMLTAAALCVPAALPHSRATYNDIAFRSYINFGKDSAIPNLFRNDAVFGSYKEHPPVISDGVEYVPLEIFYGLSGVKISFSDDGTNFYIQNKNKNKYISFSITGGYAVTGSNKIHDAKVQNFYGVQYVPLRAVCSATGIGCDSFNDGNNKLYVIKVYTVPGLSAKELIKIHAPTYYDTSHEQVPENTPEKEPEKPEKEERYTTTELILFFQPESFRNIEQTLDVLKRRNIRATFFVTAEQILSSPGIIRRIVTEKHTIGIGFSESADELYSENVLEERLMNAENALSEVIKTKTRIVYLPETDGELYKDADIAARTKRLGVFCPEFNIVADTENYGATKAFARLTDGIKSVGKGKRSAVAYIRFSHSPRTVTVLNNLAELTRKHPELTFEDFSDAKGNIVTEE